MIRYEKMSQFTSQEKEKIEECKLKKFNKCFTVAKKYHRFRLCNFFTAAI